MVERVSLCQKLYRKKQRLGEGAGGQISIIEQEAYTIYDGVYHGSSPWGNFQNPITRQQEEEGQCRSVWGRNYLVEGFPKT